MSRLRIISGLARGRKLNMVPGNTSRPITDRVKEALFNIIGEDIPGCNFLDLFGGTGSVGIEALSRGASFVRFVDSNKSAIKTIENNLELTSLDGKAEVLQLDAFDMLARAPDRIFDYVFIAPPQYKSLWEKAIGSLDKIPEWVSDDGWVIVQIDPKENEDLALKNFSEFDNRKYGNTLILFYERCQL